MTIIWCSYFRRFSQAGHRSMDGLNLVLSISFKESRAKRDSWTCDSTKATAIRTDLLIPDYWSLHCKVLQMFIQNMQDAATFQMEVACSLCLQLARNKGRPGKWICNQWRCQQGDVSLHLPATSSPQTSLTDGAGLDWRTGWVEGRWVQSGPESLGPRFRWVQSCWDRTGSCWRLLDNKLFNSFGKTTWVVHSRPASHVLCQWLAWIGKADYTQIILKW